MGKTDYTTREKNTGRNKATREMDGAGIRQVEGNERRFALSFSSEIPYRRFWGTEILDHSEGCADLSRLNEIGCVLFNHKRDAVVGKIIKAWVEDGRGMAEIEFDDDEESEKIRKKVSSGTLKGVSVGYSVKRWEDVPAGKKSEDGRFEGPCSIAKEWEALEISSVSVPADQTVGVMRQEEGEEWLMEIYGRQAIANRNKSWEGK